jgi:hypothetical protein
MGVNDTFTDTTTELGDMLDARVGVRCTVECPRGEGTWHVRHVMVYEALTRPYHINLSLVSDNLDLIPTNWSEPPSTASRSCAASMASSCVHTSKGE